MSIADAITTAVPAPDAPPGSVDWKRRCTASKVAGMVGASKFTSRYETWHMMAGNIPGDATTYAMLRGIHFEQGVVDLWHALNPDWEVEDTTTWQSAEHPWLYATPDRLVRSPEGEAFVLEAKTAATWDGWGPDGSSIIPVDYDYQTLVQHTVTGLPVLVVVVGPSFRMRTYVRRPETWMVGAVVEEIEAFMETLPGGANEQEPEPAVDDEQTVLSARPIYRGWTRELDDDDPDAVALATARIALDDAESVFAARRMTCLMRMEEAEAVRWRGRTVLSRRSDGALYVAPATTMKELVR